MERTRPAMRQQQSLLIFFRNIEGVTFSGRDCVSSGEMSLDHLFVYIWVRSFATWST